MVKDPPVNAGELTDSSWIPGFGRPLRGGHDGPLQYSPLEMDGGASWAIVQTVTKRQT